MEPDTTIVKTYFDVWDTHYTKTILSTFFKDAPYSESSPGC